MNKKSFHVMALALAAMALASCGTPELSSSSQASQTSSDDKSSSVISSEQSTQAAPSSESSEKSVPTSSSDSPSSSSTSSEEAPSSSSEEEPSSLSSSEESLESSLESEPSSEVTSSEESSTEETSEVTSEETSEATSEDTSEATFESSATPETKTYDIVFKNADGTELKSYKVKEGDTPVYDGETPTKAKDSKHVYCFDGWDKPIVAATADAVYTATFIAKLYNDEAQDYASLKVNAPTNELASDFAFGADLSMVAEVEKNGGVYYNEEGIEEDVFKILAHDGVNYARFRLWNDPKSSITGDGYGGGNNDLATDIALAKRAKAAGMKVLIDFHYSDAWADPSTYRAPKAWASKASSEIPDLVEAYTKESLLAFKEAGITVDSVQIGNESNSGIAGVARSDSNYVKVYASGIKGAKAAFPNIKTIVHLTQTSKNYNTANAVLKSLKEASVDYDIVGVSYYSYYHGAQSNYFSFLNSVASTYGKPVICAETSYGFTDAWVEGVTSNSYWSQKDEIPGGYATGAQGQASLMADIVDGLSKVPNKKGVGIFYWEPDWLPVKGATNTTKAGQYYLDKGTDGTASQLSGYSDWLASWSNQALFSYTGKALPSASTYKHIQDKDRTVEVKDVELKTSSFDVAMSLGIDDLTDKLPAKTTVKTNLDQYREVSIVWNETDIAKVTSIGTYTVKGSVAGAGGKVFEVTANVTVTGNLLTNSSFEDGNMGGWTITNADRTYCYETSATDSVSNIDGKYHVKWWYGSQFSFTFSQKMTSVSAGTYAFSGLIMADGTYKSLQIWYQIGAGDKVTKDVPISGWNGGVMPEVKLDNIVLSESSDVTVGFSATNASSGAWGHCDKFSFLPA